MKSKHFYLISSLTLIITTRQLFAAGGDINHNFLCISEYYSDKDIHRSGFIPIIKKENSTNVLDRVRTLDYVSRIYKPVKNKRIIINNDKTISMKNNKDIEQRNEYLDSQEYETVYRGSAGDLKKIKRLIESNINNITEAEKQLKKLMILQNSTMPPGSNNMIIKACILEPPKIEKDQPTENPSVYINDVTQLVSSLSEKYKRRPTVRKKGCKSKR